MAKKILVFSDSGIVAQVSEDDYEFEVHPSLEW